MKTEGYVAAKKTDEPKRTRVVKLDDIVDLAADLEAEAANPRKRLRLVGPKKGAT